MAQPLSPELLAILQKQGLTYNPNAAPPPQPQAPPPPPQVGLGNGPWIQATRPQQPDLSKPTGPARFLPPSALPAPVHKEQPVDATFDTAPEVASPGGGAASPQPTFAPPQTIPAHFASTVSPDTRKEVDTAFDEQKGAAELGLQGDLAANEGHVRSLNGIERSMTDAQSGLNSREDRRQKLFQGMRNRYDGMRKDVAQSGEPNYTDLFGGMDLGQRSFATLGLMLSGLGSAMDKRPNQALELLKDRIQRNVAEQRDALAKKRGNLEEAKGGLGEARQQFGDERLADTVEYARQLEAFKIAGDAEAAASNSPAILAHWAQIKAGINTVEADKHGTIEKAVAAQTIGGGPSDAQVAQKAFELLKESKGELNPEQAYTQARAVLTQHGIGGQSLPYGQHGTEGGEKRFENIQAHDAAIDNIQKLLALRQKHGGGQLLPGNDSSAADALAARSQEQLVAALGKTNKGLLDRTSALIPDHPLATKFTGLAGADPIGTRLQTALQMLKEERGKLGGQTQTAPAPMPGSFRPAGG
jgi:hypothetical protein